MQQYNDWMDRNKRRRPFEIFYSFLMRRKEQEPFTGAAPANVAGFLIAQLSVLFGKYASRIYRRRWVLFGVNGRFATAEIENEFVNSRYLVCQRAHCASPDFRN